jgi:predicted dehydrogenase
MLSRDDIDLIYIGTPPDTHIQYCHLCLDKGKAIWCEKPLATDIIQAQQLVSRIGEMKVKAAVNLSLDQVFQYVAKDSHQ